jgi:hypothetical protein
MLTVVDGTILSVLTRYTLSLRIQGEYRQCLHLTMCVHSCMNNNYYTITSQKMPMSGS